MQTKAIKQKLKSVGSIKKITKTMEMVSAAKMKKAIDRALSLRPFHDEAQVIISDIAHDELIKHPLLSKHPGKPDVIVLVASHKGLCGSYNTNMYRLLCENYSEEQRKELKVIAIGKYAEKIAKRIGANVIASFQTPHFESSDARVLTKLVVKDYLEEKHGRVLIAYTRFAKASSFVPELTTLLPFEIRREGDTSGEARFEYEPDIESVITHIVPLLLENIILSSVSESYASEHSSRMFAMKSATDNANELQKELKLYYNRARQDAVTQEIAEITSGAMALSQ